MPLRFAHQLFCSRDFWLHALTLPSWLVQQLFMTETPSMAQPAFHLPAERCPHVRTLMAWPDEMFNENADDLLLAQQEVARIANAVAKYEPVRMYASHRNIEVAESHLSRNVKVVEINVERPWLRDTGPVLVTQSDADGRLTGIDFNFNYWDGNSVVPTGVDRIVARQVIEHSDIRQLTASIVADGTAFEVDGEGTMLVAESSLLSPTRNEDRDKVGMEETFHELLGVKKTIWLKGVEGTYGHIDQLARFGPNSSIVILSRPHRSIPSSHPKHVAYQQAKAVLSISTNAAGTPFIIVEIEEAATIALAEERGLPSGCAGTSYTTFYLVNGAVIVPQYGEHRTDEAAVKAMQQLFPDRTVEKVMLSWMPLVGGGLHGATVQWPSAPGCDRCR